MSCVEVEGLSTFLRFLLASLSVCYFGLSPISGRPSYVNCLPQLERVTTLVNSLSTRLYLMLVGYNLFVLFCKAFKFIRPTCLFCLLKLFSIFYRLLHSYL